MTKSRPDHILSSYEPEWKVNEGAPDYDWIEMKHLYIRNKDNSLQSNCSGMQALRIQVNNLVVMQFVGA